VSCLRVGVVQNWFHGTRRRDIAALKAHERELRTAGGESTSKFGSVARGEYPATAGRGLPGAGAPLLQPPERDGRAAVGILGCKVDVIEEPVRKKGFQTRPPAGRHLVRAENAHAIRRYAADMGIGANRAD